MRERAATGSEGISFEAFFESNYERLLRAVYLVRGDRHEAEDVAQEAFMKLYERSRERDEESCRPSLPDGP